MEDECKKLSLPPLIMKETGIYKIFNNNKFFWIITNDEKIIQSIHIYNNNQHNNIDRYLDSLHNISVPIFSTLRAHLNLLL